MRNLLIAAVAFLGAFPCPAQVSPDPTRLLARDTHEGLSVAADPYTDVARDKARFGKKNPHDAGIMAIELFFRNDNDKPIRLELGSIRLLLAPPEAARQRLEPMAVADVVDRVLNKEGPNPTVPRRQIPFPGRGPQGGRGKDWDQLESALRLSALEMDILPPRSTVHGFLYFDINHRYDFLAYARLVVNDLKYVHNNQALLYFEIDLARAALH